MQSIKIVEQDNTVYLEQCKVQWDNYLQQLKDKYSEVPARIKTAIIERDFKNMFGSRYVEFLNSASEDWDLLLENALAELSKTVKKNILKKEWEFMAYREYSKVLASGMFPNYTGEWKKDEKNVVWFFISNEERKEYVKLILS